jgi:hypothetical protein
MHAMHLRAVEHTMRRGLSWTSEASANLTLLASAAAMFARWEDYLAEICSM